MKGQPITLEQLSAVEPLLSDEERMVRDTVRRFVRERFLPKAGERFEREEFPTEMIPEIAALGLLGAALTGYGCAGMSAVSYGLALAELEYGDSGLRSFVSVQGSLSMYPIWRWGSAAQKDRLLTGMAKGEIIGCFGLSEPDAGSDPGAMKTRARRDGNGWVLHGTKMWITNAPLAHVAVVWAKTDEGDQDSIRGFLVERGMKGFETPTIKGKMSLRASPTGEIVLDGCRVPDENVLPEALGLGAPLACLNEARFGISCAVLGAARACFETAVSYTQNRVAFGKPIAAKQLVQERLVWMAQEIVKAEIMVLHFARLKDAGKITPQQVSLCKRNNCKIALEIARETRALLGGNGILLDYPAIRHALNLESVYTYEGTHEVHTLVLGRALTGFDAFLPPLASSRAVGAGGRRCYRAGPLRAYTPLTTAAQAEFLRSLLERARARVAAGGLPVVVFDLDGTLLDNRPRTAAIFRELAAAWEKEHPEAAGALSHASAEHIVYGVNGSLTRVGVSPDHHPDATAFWKDRFFQDPHLEHDVPVPGAADFVRRLHALGASIVYVTGRDLPNMSMGTWASLRNHGFPIGVVGTTLVCKPDFAIPDEDFKREALPTLVRYGEVIASFDNEPGNCNVALAAFPGAASVLLATQHTDDAPEPHPSVVILRDFVA